jgi:hypothetical protein
MATFENLSKQWQDNLLAKEGSKESESRSKINNFLLKSGHDLNRINYDNLNFDNMTEVADNLVKEWNTSQGKKGLNPEKAYYEWLDMTHEPLMNRQISKMASGTREFGNNMNNIQKQVYDLRNQFQPPISPYNQQQISPDEYQKQRQQKWGNLPPVSSSVYDSYSNGRNNEVSV